MAAVSSKEGLGYAAVQGSIERRVSEKVEWDEFKELEEVGVDAIALKQGHQDFVTIVTTRLATGSIRVLGVLAGREKATVKNFFLVFPRSYVRPCKLYVQTWMTVI